MASDTDQTLNPFIYFFPSSVEKATAVLTRLPFYLPENMVNHKKMVHPPCASAAAACHA